MMRTILIAASMMAFANAVATTAAAGEIKVLHGGAFTQMMTAIVPDFEKATGNKVVTERDTVGALMKAIEGGASFDMAVLTPEAIDELIKKGRVVAGSRADLAKVGVGVVVKSGTPRPDIGSVDAFKKTLIDAKSVAYIDPQAGGSSGIYVARLLDKLGIAAEIKPKAVLIHGGAVAEHVVDGEAEIGIHQISEILPVKGATLVGPLPEEIQNLTVYSAGISSNARDPGAAKALIASFATPKAIAMMKERGVAPVAP
jgi:molybdate transport system substrate-binding protein